MNKVIFFNFPTHGCINALLATTKELVKRGENIIYYCTEEFREKIEKTGARFMPYPGQKNEFDLAHFDLFKALKLNIKMTANKMGPLTDIVQQEKPDYIIHDSLCTWGKHIAALLKIPAVNLMHSFPISKSSVRISADVIYLIIQQEIYRLQSSFSKNHPLNILYKKYRTNVSLTDIFINKEELNIIYTSRQMEPNLYKAEKSYVFVGPSLFFKNGKKDLPYEKLKDKNVIYISLGTLLGNNFSFFETCIEAFSNTPYNIIISTGHFINPADFGALPDNFLIRQSLPQQQLLSNVRLFITHGGMNSVNEAIYYGVPMILLPHTIEQKIIANRVQQMAIGKVLNIKKLTAHRLYQNSIEIINNPAYKNQSNKYKVIFQAEEEMSHIKAADTILNYITKARSNQSRS